MRKLSVIWLFYRRLLLLAITAAVFAGSLVVRESRAAFFAFAGMTFMIALPFMHYFLYELMRRDDYYFYANLGFDRRFLWACTLVASFVLGTLLSVFRYIF